jgi:hypothetical protein
MSEQFYNNTRRYTERTRFRSNPGHRPAPEKQLGSAQRLVAEIDRDISLLDAEIAAEEIRTGIADRTNFKYSLVANQMRSRLDNLACTKVALLKRLSHSGPTG